MSKPTVEVAHFFAWSCFNVPHLSLCAVPVQPPNSKASLPCQCKWIASCTAQFCMSLELCQIKHQNFTDVHSKYAQSKDGQQKPKVNKTTHPWLRIRHLDFKHYKALEVMLLFYFSLSWNPCASFTSVLSALIGCTTMRTAQPSRQRWSDNPLLRHLDFCATFMKGITIFACK